MRDTQWANRIIRHEDVDPSLLVANPYNFRRHPKSQQDAMVGVLNEIGWIDDVIVNVTTGHILDGHLRVEMALANNERTVPVKYVELTEAQEFLALSVFDPITGLAEIDAHALAQLLGRVEMTPVEDAGLAALLAQLAAANVVEPEKSDVDAEPQVDRAEELRQEWGVETGDLWQLGEHRLICGDCTDADVVVRVMGGEKIRCVWTDPPYGVSYADKNEFLNALNRGNSNQTAIEHDHMSEADTEKLATDALRCAFENAEKGASVYVACPPGTLLPHFIAAVEASGFSYKHSLVWVKNQFVLGRCDYHYRHEVILYGWIENGAHYFVDDHTKHSIFEVDKPRNSDEHPTMKPIELVTPMIENSTRRGEIVYEPFSGSGTTIIACEQLGRKCRAVEISEGYVAVALQRYLDATGIRPTRLEAV